MDLNELASRKHRLAEQMVGDEMVLVPLKGSVADLNEMYTLNEVAAFIWQNMEKAETTEEMARLLTDEFDIDLATASSDLDEFITAISEFFPE